MAFEPTGPQREAIDHRDGPLCIAAGAGSGKTRTLAERVAAAVGGGGGPTGAPGVADVAEVLAVTFTEKAAGEIAERVRRVLLGHGLIADARRVDEAWISTIHGLCSRILRSNALLAGLDPEFTVADQVTTRVLQEEAFEACARDALRAGDERERLIAELGLGRVEQAVRALHGRLRSMGRTLGDVRLERACAARDMLAEAIAYHGEAGELLGGDPKPGRTMLANIEASDRAKAELDALRGWTGDEAELLREVLRIERDFCPRATVGEAAKPLVQDVKAGREELLGRIVGSVTAPLARALLELAGDFEGRYGALKAERGMLDFEDLQLAAVCLLEEHPRVAQRYREAFRLVMVDEFQDTNEVQIRLAEALSDGNLCTVGDDKQSIYGFRYADVEAYRAHTEAMVRAGARRVEFADNFRSHGDVLALVNEVFGDPSVFGADLMRLRHGRDEAQAPEWPDAVPRLQALFVAKAESADEGRRAEADAVAGRLAGLRAAGVRQGDMVVLLRALTHADTYTRALQAHGLAYVVSAGGSFFGRPEVEAMRCLLRGIANACDAEGVFGLLASGLVGVSDDGLMRLRQEGGAEVFAAATSAGLSEADAALVGRAEAALGKARRGLGRRTLGETLLQACEDLDYDLYLLAQGDEGRQAYANVLKFIRLAEEYEQVEAGPSGFLEHLALKERFADREAPAAILDEEADVVRVMTIHGAKGLEFPVVAVPDLGRTQQADRECFAIERRHDGLLLSLSLPDERGGLKREERTTPLFRSLREVAAARDREEEQRLFYVACTRAKEALILAGCTDVDGPAGDKRGDDTCAVDWLRRGVGLAEAPLRGVEAVALPGGASIAVSVIEPSAAAAVAAPRRVARVVRAPAPPVRDERPASVPASPPATVSYSDLALFGVCPLRYHFERRSRLGALPDTGGPSARDLGDAVHAALALVSSSGSPPDPARRQALARRWRLDPSAEGRFHAAVDAFLASEAYAAAYADGGRPLHEVPFAVRVTGTLLVGKVDLLRTDGERALIVDYKTGAGDSGVDPGRFEGQARCYALAAMAGGAREVELRFVALEQQRDGRPQEVVLRFAAADAAAIRDEIDERVAAMSAPLLPPLARYEPRACDECPAAGAVCAVGAPARLTRRSRTPA